MDKNKYENHSVDSYHDSRVNQINHAVKLMAKQINSCMSQKETMRNLYLKMLKQIAVGCEKGINET